MVFKMALILVLEKRKVFFYFQLQIIWRLSEVKKNHFQKMIIFNVLG